MMQSGRGEWARNKLGNRLSSSLSSIPSLLRAPPPWMSRQRAPGSRPHVTTRFCAVLLVGILFALFSLFLAEYTLTGPRGVQRGNTRQAITAHFLLKTHGADDPADDGHGPVHVTKEQYSRFHSAFDLRHYLPHLGRTEPPPPPPPFEADDSFVNDLNGNAATDGGDGAVGDADDGDGKDDSSGLDGEGDKSHYLSATSTAVTAADADAHTLTNAESDAALDAASRTINPPQLKHIKLDEDAPAPGGAPRITPPPSSDSTIAEDTVTGRNDADADADSQASQDADAQQAGADAAGGRGQHDADGDLEDLERSAEKLREEEDVRDSGVDIVDSRSQGGAEDIDPVGRDENVAADTSFDVRDDDVADDGARDDGDEDDGADLGGDDDTDGMMDTRGGDDLSGREGSEDVDDEEVEDPRQVDDFEDIADADADVHGRESAHGFTQRARTDSTLDRDAVDDTRQLPPAQGGGEARTPEAVGGSESVTNSTEAALGANPPATTAPKHAGDAVEPALTPSDSPPPLEDRDNGSVVQPSDSLERTVAPADTTIAAALPPPLEVNSTTSEPTETLRADSPPVSAESVNQTSISPASLSSEAPPAEASDAATSSPPMSSDSDTTSSSSTEATAAPRAEDGTAPLTAEALPSPAAAGNSSLNIGTPVSAVTFANSSGLATPGLDLPMRGEVLERREADAVVGTVTDTRSAAVAPPAFSANEVLASVLAANKAAAAESKQRMLPVEIVPQGGPAEELVLPQPHGDLGSAKYHVVVVASGTPSEKWQALVNYYWYKKVRTEARDGPMGGYTRLLHSGEPDDIMSLVPTIVVDKLPGSLSRARPGIHRAWALTQWLSRVLIPEAYVLVVEPDTVWLSQPGLWATPAHGAAFPTALVDCEYESTGKLCERPDLNPKGIARSDIVQAGGAPFMMHKKMLAALLPTWDALTRKAASDADASAAWHGVEEMFAFALASATAASEPMQLSYHSEFEVQPPMDEHVTVDFCEPHLEKYGQCPDDEAGRFKGASMIHYASAIDLEEDGTACTDCEEKNGFWHWSKQDFADGTFPGPIPAPPEDASEAVVMLVKYINEAALASPYWQAKTAQQSSEVPLE